MKRVYMGCVIVAAYGIYIGGQVASGQPPEDGVVFGSLAAGLVYLLTGKKGPVLKLNGATRTLKEL